MALLKEKVCVKKRRSGMRAAVVLLALTGVNLLPAMTQAQGSLEYAVKAAYLVKFAPFIDWPDGTFTSPDVPLNICVVGTDPFGQLLDRAAQGQRDGDHPVTIRRPQVPDASCQILFAGGDEAVVENALQQIKDRAVLTVTDSSFRARGIINFAVIDDHVRFDIDEAAADAASIRISSKLLELAHAVKRSARQP